MGERYFDPAYAAHRFALAYDRGLYAQSAGRQLAAMAASGAASDLLRTIDIPTLVIHGTADPFFAPESGKRTADLIPGAHLMLLDGMGHDLPPQLFPLVAGAIAGHTRTPSALSNREENR